MPKDDFGYSTTRKFVVEDVVNSGQKMAEEALFLVKWNLYLWSQLVLPLLSAFALKCAEILFNWVSFSCNVTDPDLFQSQKCGFTQPKVKFLAYLHANSDPRGSTSWYPKQGFHKIGDNAPSAIFWPEITTSSTTSNLVVDYPKSSLHLVMLKIWREERVT